MQSEPDYNYYLFSHNNDGLILLCECLKDDNYYEIDFKVTNDKLEIVHIETNSEKNNKERVEYDYDNSKVTIDGNKIQIDLNYSFIFADSSTVKFEISKVFLRDKDIHKYRYEIFDKLDEKFKIKYIEKLIASKQLYGNSSFIYDNIDSIFELIKKIDCKKVEIEKIALDQRIDEATSIKYAQQFLDELSIDFDIEQKIRDNTIKFIDDNSGNVNGRSFYNSKRSKKLITVNKRNDLLMPAVLVHEIIHYINQPEDDNRNYVSDYLTEAVSYSYELMFLDSFLKSDYKEDALSIMQSLAYSMKQAVFSAFSPAFSLKLYKLNSKIEKETIEKSFSFENYKNEMTDFIMRQQVLLNYVWNVIGYSYAISNFISYKKDSSFADKILELNNSINDKSLSECLNIIGLEKLDDDKPVNSIDEYTAYVKKHRSNRG